MANSNEAEQLKLYLAEALDMLNDIKHKMALFEKQRYYRWKVKLEHHNRLSGELRTSLEELHDGQKDDSKNYGKRLVIVK